ncbi:uncharacterized protein M421DRAFT_425366 [Didymella exigua CBS 183.55]|uniref:Cell wall protein n=1 Tax=Didymella exigua CBS 183.55 TaxID=1150837 RepID=A0A6A5R9J3_9PLEO|nr:uncharacterized protein M421DRAFT_425366 [Didymella exigua CBS 183.55]KAF1923868.1 hypothetical protein M421DRAFT_425366 [Didymella exigua CBS 183.55]
MLFRLLTLLFAASGAYALPKALRREAQANSSCDALKYSHLIGSIQETMFIQKQELQGLQTLLSLSTNTGSLTAPTNGTQSDFQLNQISIVSAELKAIAIRERSQILADELSSPSAKGLAMVAQSQAAVMIDMQSLKEGREGDTKMLESLVRRVKDAMIQEEKNLNVADGECGK